MFLAAIYASVVDRGFQPSDDSQDESYPHVYDQSLDRLACALGGKEVLPPAFQYIPSMLASYDWRLRHAGLMAIAAIAEGTSKVRSSPVYHFFIIFPS
jgi:hypothetical protein